MKNRDTAGHTFGSSPTPHSDIEQQTCRNQEPEKARQLLVSIRRWKVWICARKSPKFTDLGASALSAFFVHLPQRTPPQRRRGRKDYAERSELDALELELVIFSQ
jgi:hypothetical protein